jgi:hypothetical protein
VTDFSKESMGFSPRLTEQILLENPAIGDDGLMFNCKWTKQYGTPWLFRLRKRIYRFFRGSTHQEITLCPHIVMKSIRWP